MLKRAITALLGSRHERERRRIQPIVDAINDWDAKLQTASEADIRAQTAKFRAQIAERALALEQQIAQV